MRDDYNLLFTEERNIRSAGIDKMSTLEMVRVINGEDKKIAEAIEAQLPEIAEAIDIIASALRAGGHLIYIGAGTSGRLGVVDASECPPTFGVDPSLVRAIIAGGEGAMFCSAEGFEDSEERGREALYADGVSSGDVVVGLSASGRAPYVGPEVISGSTRLKAGTAQKMVLNMLSTGAMIKLGLVRGNLMVNVRPTNRKLRERAARIIMELGGCDRERALELLEKYGEVAPALGELEATGDKTLA